jgi:transposase-like protein
VLRESVAWMAAQLMETDVAARIGAELGERTPDRLTHRNGYRPWAWDTRVGQIELAIPKLAMWPVNAVARSVWGGGLAG